MKPFLRALLLLSTLIITTACDRDLRTCNCTMTVDENVGTYKIITQEMMTTKEAKKYCESQTETLNNGIFIKETSCTVEK